MGALAVAAPDHDFVCVGDQRAFEAWTPRASNVRCVLVDQQESPTLAARADGHRSLADMLRLTRAVRKTAVDVFFSPSVYSYFPLPWGLPAVVTVHDTIAERYPKLTLPTLRARLFWRLKVALALRQAKIILTVSDYSARSISAVLGVAPAKIRVAIEAPSAAYRPCSDDAVAAAAARAGLPPGVPWFAYVGGFNPHKRVDTIIRAHASIRRSSTHASPHLVLIGHVGGDAFFSEEARLRRLVAQEESAPFVHWTGFLPDDEVACLLSGALATLLPSECEGFGLPAVESAACGTPVIATTESPLPELLHDGGIFIQPGDGAALERAMREMIADPARRSALGSAALIRASSLSWERCARSALAAIEEAA